MEKGPAWEQQDDQTPSMHKMNFFASHLGKEQVHTGSLQCGGSLMRRVWVHVFATGQCNCTCLLSAATPSLLLSQPCPSSSKEQRLTASNGEAAFTGEAEPQKYFHSGLNPLSVALSPWENCRVHGIERVGKCCFKGPCLLKAPSVRSLLTWMELSQKHAMLSSRCTKHELGEKIGSNCLPLSTFSVHCSLRVFSLFPHYELTKLTQFPQHLYCHVWSRSSAELQAKIFPRIWYMEINLQLERSQGYTLQPSACKAFALPLGHRASS